MAGGKAGKVEGHPGEADGLRLLALAKEPVGDAALVEDLDRAGVETAGP